LKGKAQIIRSLKNWHKFMISGTASLRFDSRSSIFCLVYKTERFVTGIKHF
jgi:hypothetical protein